MRYHAVSTPLRADQTVLHRVGLTFTTIPVQPPAGHSRPSSAPMAPCDAAPA